MLKRLLCLLTISLLAVSYVFSQVTTSSITGSVKDKGGQPLVGATVTAVHTPSGTTYTTTAGKDGVFNLPNMRIGGPYNLSITFAGQDPYTIEGFTLQLGQPYTVTAVMGEKEQSLEAVVVTGRGRRTIADKVGTSTNISNRQISTLPTISRSITDFTRLTPQANGNSFAGRDARFNNITVDGANLNNNFGLSTDALPGGGNPISLDAIDEISVNIAPFDVRQSNFTGANIAAVTRSGDNTFKGSAYGYYRNQNYNGKYVGDFDLPPFLESSSKTYGARIGGPIIKNKVFFFVSLEREMRDFPSTTLRPSQPGVSGPSASATPLDSLKKLSEYLASAYKYNTGVYDNIPSFSSENTKILGRIDWNITNSHRLTLKYSDYNSKNPNNGITVNGSSIPGGGISGGSYNGNNSVSITRLGNNRFSNNSYAFENSNYGFTDIVRSGSLELNSKFGTKFGNQLLGTITKVQDTRSYKGGFFPTIDFLNVSPTTVPNNANYMSVGMDPFTPNNDVVNDIYSVTDNFTYFAGKHTITAGGSYEYQRVGNMFMPGSNSYYLFRSLNDFTTNQLPIYYGYTYSLVPGQKTVYSANLKLGQLGFYAQDEFQTAKNFKLTMGLRVDRPIYLEQPLSNPAFAALKFQDANGVTTSYTTGEFPKSSWYFSPRVGFRWDVADDRNMILRGGVGLFTGRIPFVFLTNIPTNSGMYQNTVAVYNTVAQPNALNGYNFNQNPDAYRANFPDSGGKAIANNPSFVSTNPDFKFPQVFRTSLGMDKTLGAGFTFTLEALYTKEINGVYMRNANLPATTTTFTGSPDLRPRYLTGTNKINTNINNNIVLENTNKGGAFSATAQLTKSFSRGFYGSIAYTYTFAQDVTANPGSQASSVWNSNPNYTTANDPVLSYSSFAVPHRVVANLSYRIEYLKSLATTISLFYEGSHDGTFSYTYSADMNNDGNGFDLVYIPRNASEVNFLATNTINGVTYTAAQQWAILDKFIENDPYLREHRGQYAERNGARLPWYNKIDAKLLQDVFTNIGGRRHSLQFSVDVLNLPNLINKNWGIHKSAVLRNLLVPNGTTTAGGAPVFRLNTSNSQPQIEPYQDIQSTFSTWGIQLGLRYNF